MGNNINLIGNDWVTITKICPVCENEFKTKKNHPREKTTCSHSCANVFFRSGLNHPNWKGGIEYRKRFSSKYDLICLVCGEENIVDLHHFDYNRNNNNLDNLVPLCLTHHRYMHTKFRDLIVEDVIAYIEKTYNKKIDRSVLLKTGNGRVR